jgi:hypothetical protein
MDSPEKAWTASISKTFAAAASCDLERSPRKQVWRWQKLPSFSYRYPQIIRYHYTFDSPLERLVGGFLPHLMDSEKRLRPAFRSAVDFFPDLPFPASVRRPGKPLFFPLPSPALLATNGHPARQDF